MAGFSTKQRILGAATGLSILVGAVALSVTQSAPAVAGGAAQDDCRPIGTAWMIADGTLRLNLRAEGPGGIVGHSFPVYPPDHPRYAVILAHLGDIAPGESRLVRSFSPECNVQAANAD